MFQSVIIGTAVISIIISIAVAARCYFSTKHTIERMERMLDEAIQGGFVVERIDESTLSALEFKLARYLDASAISAGNTAAEKERLQILLSDISHQTKNPIASLRLYSELLQEQLLSEESRSYVNIIASQTQKLDFLISSLIKISRLETGVLSLHPKNGAVMPMLKKACEQFTPAAEAKGLTLCIEPFGIEPSGTEFLNTEPCAVFDEKWTLEALCNLLDNAVKYTETGGITIRLIPYELFCRIEIADTGIGIAEEEQAQVFSRFYRSPSVSDKEGVGIGLYLAREIISFENGYIRLSSAPGKGSVFTFCLPAASSGLQSRETPPSPQNLSKP